MSAGILVVWADTQSSFGVDFNVSPLDFAFLHPDWQDDWREMARLGRPQIEHVLDPNFRAEFALRDRFTRRGAAIHQGYDDCKTVIARLKAEGAL